MILGSKSRYAVMAMVELAGHAPDSPVRLAELSEAQEITLPYLEQIFSKLKQAGLVTATRGPGGGYVLARPAEAIYIGEVVSAVEEPIKMTRCSSHDELEGREGCMSSKTRCLTHNLWEGLEKHIYNYLYSFSLADVRARALSQPQWDKLLAESLLVN